jgi:hypothetical protein
LPRRGVHFEISQSQSPSSLAPSLNTISTTDHDQPFDSAYEHLSTNNTIVMSLTAEQQENFEDIEKQFAVKGAPYPLCH